MNDYLINYFSLPCKCGGSVSFRVIIGKDINETINDMGFISLCESCNRGSGISNDISEAYLESQSVSEDFLKHQNEQSI